MKNLIIIFLGLLLVSCTSETSVHQEHIDEAHNLCKDDSGISLIKKTSVSREVEGCGRGCIRNTGRTEYYLSVACKTGTVFSKAWTK